MISACCSGAKVKIADIKFLVSNKIFLLSLRTNNVEAQNDKKLIVFVSLIM